MGHGWLLVPGARAAVGGRRGARRLVRDVAVDRVAGAMGLRRFRSRSDHVRLVAPTLDALVAAESQLSTQDVRRLTVTVVWWVAPARGWAGRLGPLDGVNRQRIALPRRGRGRATVDIQLDALTSLGSALAAALHALRPFRRLPVGGAARVGDEPAILIDTARVNPRGRRPESYRDDAPAFTLVDGQVDRGAAPDQTGPRNAMPWRWSGATAWRSVAGEDLSWATVAALRSVGSVTAVRGVREDARLLVQLAATGVLVHGPTLTDTTARLLSSELRAILAEPLPHGDLEREIRSVRQRRAALRDHSVRFGRWTPPTVSVLLATRRRHNVPSALRMVAEQTYPNLEIILGLHGIEPPDEELLRALGRPIQVVDLPGEMPFGEVLDIAATRAGGEIVTKMDDDDTYSNEHVWDLVLARDYSGATLVGKGIEFVYLGGPDLTVRRWSGQPESDTTTVAGGTLTIGREDLREVGGWPHAPLYEDRALLDRLAEAGAVMYRTHPLGYLYHRQPQATGGDGARRSRGGDGAGRSRGGDGDGPRDGTGHAWAAADEYFLRGATRRWAGPIDVATLSGRAPAS